MNNKIQSGFQYRVRSHGYSIGVIYTTEFVDRIYDRKLDPELADAKLRLGLDKITEYADGDPKFTAIIKSRSTDLNVVVIVTSNRKDKMSLIVKTVMQKRDFMPSKISDYEIMVNPQAKVRFEPGTDPMIKYFVLCDLVTRRIKEGRFYHFGSEVVDYMIDYEGYIGIPHAEWADGVCAIDVK